ncbi:MAG: hypothetical protein ABL923_00920 [Burkholderiaceae bacterium]
MFKALLTVVTFALLSTTTATFAADAHGDKERKEDVNRHRAMAKAHTDAAICLESGKKEEDCSKALQTACKGLAIGKDCGMKHAH